MKFVGIDGFQQIVKTVEAEGLHSILVIGGGENDGDGFWHLTPLLFPSFLEFVLYHVYYLGRHHL